MIIRQVSAEWFSVYLNGACIADFATLDGAVSYAVARGFLPEIG